MSGGSLIVVEDDPFTRLIPIILDPKSPPDRLQAFADFMSHDESDFEGWLDKVRTRAGKLPKAGPPDAVTKRIVSETARWKALIAKTGVKPQ